MIVKCLREKINEHENFIVQVLPQWPKKLVFDSKSYYFMKQFLLFIFLFVSIPLLSSAQNLSAKEIVKKAEEKMQGEKSSYSVMTIQIVRPTWTRTISIKAWTLGKDYALSLITSPAAEKGKSFLKRQKEMWSWDPTISRMIKMPPSMLSEGWMGSDFTNDDMLNSTSLANDFNQKILGEEIFEQFKCFKIEMIPIENSAVVWGKIILWVSENDFLQLKTEYYDDDLILVKTELAHDIKIMDNRKIPTRFEIIPAETKGNKTIVIINDIKFNIDIKESFFAQQNMKNVR